MSQTQSNSQQSQKNTQPDKDAQADKHPSQAEGDRQTIDQDLEQQSKKKQ